MDYLMMVYGICMAVGIIYTLAAFLMGGFADLGLHLGDMGGGHGEFNHDYGVTGSGHGEASGASADAGPLLFGPFSPLVVAFFLTCFGGTGVLLTTIAPGMSKYLGLSLAVASGFLLAWALIAFFNRLLGGMQSSSEVRLYTLIGSDAEVTVAIPAVGVGEVAYVAMGSRYVSPARSDEQVNLPRFATVRITRIVGNTFFVRQVLEEQLRDMEGTPVAPNASTEE